MIETELNKLIASKAAIKQAITDKTGKDAGDVLSTYAEQIQSITTGEGLDYFVEDVNVDITNNYDTPVVNILTSNNEIYFVYNNIDRDSWYSVSYTCTSGKVNLAKGHLNETGEYVEDVVINSTLSSGTTAYDYFNLDYDYVVLKASGLIRYWKLTASTLNGFKVSPGNQKIVEAIADLPAYEGLDDGNTIYNSRFLKKFTLKNAKPKYLRKFFVECYNLEEFITENCDFSTLTKINSMFYQCRSIKSISFSNWNANINDVSQCFYYCRSVESIDLNGLNLDNCTSFTELFSNCHNLKEIKGLKCTGNKVVTIGYMFTLCKTIQEIDLSECSFGNITGSSRDVFSNCNSLKILKLPTLDLSGATDTRNIFSGCVSLIFDDDLLDKIFNFKISNKCTNATSLFNSCFNLTDIDVSLWDLSGSKDNSSMFINCYSLLNIKLPTCDIDGNISNMFGACLNLTTVDLSSLTGISSFSCSSLFSKCYNLKSIKLPKNLNPTTTYTMFNDCRSLESIEGLETMDTSSVTTFDSMFYYCYSLKNIDLSNFTIGANCTTLSNMFRECMSLEEIVFNSTLNHNTSKVTSVSYIIANCFNLKRFECNIPFENLTGTSSVATECINLRRIDTLFSISKVTANPPSYTNDALLEYIKYSSQPTINYNLSTAINLSKSCLLETLNALPKVSAKTLTLGDLRTKLTADELKIATDKGWTVA